MAECQYRYPVPASSPGGMVTPASYFKFTTGDGYYFYDFNTNGIVRVEKQLYDLLDRFVGQSSQDRSHEAAQVIREMQAKRLLTRGPDEVIAPPLCDACITEKLDTAIQQVCLELTEQCNLRCRYCAYSGKYADNRRHSPRMMTEATARQAVDYFLARSHTVEHPVVSFYGGEPLLNRKVLVKCVEHARQHDSRGTIGFSVDTNGTCVDDTMLSFFMEHEFIIQISLDGPRRVHDRNRVSRDGAGSWDRVSALLHRIHERDPEYFARRVIIALTLAPPYDVKSIDAFFRQEPFASLNLMVSFVDEEGIDLRKVYAQEFAAGDVYADLRAFRADYVARMCSGRRNELSSFARALFDRPLIDLLSRDTRTADGRISCNGICVPGQRKLFVAADGRLFPCEKVGRDFAIGTVPAGIDRAAVDTLIGDYHRLCEKHCHGCWTARLCRLCFAAVRRGGAMNEQRKLSECESERNNWYNTMVLCAQIMEHSPQSLEWVKDVVIT